MFPFSQSAFGIVAHVLFTPVLYFFVTKVTFWRPVAKPQCKYLVARIRDTAADHCDLSNHLIPHQLQSTTEQLPCRDDYRRRSGWRNSIHKRPPSESCRSIPPPLKSAMGRASYRWSQAPSDSNSKSNSMLAAADLSRTGGPFWTGFWDYLWNRSPSASSVPLRASISEERLRAYLVQEIAPRYDEPATPAQPVPGTTTFTTGKPGQALDVGAAVPLIEDALRSPVVRSVTLPSAEGAGVARASVGNLETLMKQLIGQSGFEGTIGVFMLDLQTGQEVQFAMDGGQDVSTSPDVAFTASSTIKIPILVSYFIQHGTEPVSEDVNRKILNMIHKSDNVASDDVMAELSPETGPLMVTEYLRKLGLANTFMAGFFAPGSPLLQQFSTELESAHRCLH